MQKVAFLTTIFPTKDEFLIAFFDSLEEQTYKNFDIIVVNDGYKNFEMLRQKYSNLQILELPYKNTPAKNREYGINYCINNGYNVLIFGDSDDYFASNRIIKSLELLKSYDIVVNDLSLFDENGIYEEKYISNRVNNLSPIDLEFIKDKNIFGLSNTAINLNHTQNIVIPDDSIAVDWYIFSILLLEGKTAIFTNETISYYRQYVQNSVGLKDITEETFKKGIQVKKLHYLHLCNRYSNFSFELIRLSTICYENRMQTIKNPLWWELI
jgi:glycosyltransferase involved in cell wall biosynthesis